MLQHYIGTEVFENSMQHYIEAHLFSNTFTKDLLSGELFFFFFPIPSSDSYDQYLARSVKKILRNNSTIGFMNQDSQ